MTRSSLSALAVLAAAVVVLLPVAPGRAAVASGKSDFLFTDARGNPDRPLRVWLYRPAKFDAESPVVFVMHGTLRNGETYREPWIDIADRHGCLVAVPEFGAEHYPGSRMYHFGNLFDAAGMAVPRERWTFSAIEHLFDRLREETGSRRPGYFVFGHSAGAQFVHRMVLALPDARLEGAVSANAGSYTLPSHAARYPYGLEGSGIEDDRLRSALQAPLTVLLGEKDTDPEDRYLPRAPHARAQGPHRLARGKTFHAAARAAAERLGVALRWKLETVPGVGHDNARMAPAAARLLLGETPGRK